MLHLKMGAVERCQEQPSLSSFEFCIFVFRGLPASHVKATALWLSSPLWEWLSWSFSSEPRVVLMKQTPASQPPNKDTIL